AEQPIVFYECGSLDWTMIRNLFKKLQNMPNIAYEVDSLEAAKALILNKSGIGFFPEISVRQEVASGKLVMVDLSVLSNVSLKTHMIYFLDEKPAYFDDLFQLSLHEAENIITT